MGKISSLSLHLEKGPRKGEIIESGKKSKISIGRVLKGNTFAIKEDAISQKHLVIELNKANKWTVTDLDTSNGTILNNAKLPPHKPRILKDSDLIKIGYETIIRVVLNPLTPQNKTLKRKRGDAKPNIVVENPSPSPNSNPNGNAAAPLSQSVVGSTDNEPHNSGGGQENDNVNANANVNVEEMSLAQWFEQMEEWMPKHLSAVAENIICQMRARSQDFDLHIVSQY